jgi:hypothetical protein
MPIKLPILLHASIFPLATIDNARVLAFRGMLLGQITDISTVIGQELFDMGTSNKQPFHSFYDAHEALKLLKLIYQDTYGQWKHVLGPSQDPSRVLELFKIELNRGLQSTPCGIVQLCPEGVQK